VTRDLPEGAVISASDLAILRPASGLSPDRLDSVIGKRTTRPLFVGEPIEQSDIL
jgi:sialic acid synthase SpsE